MIYLYLKRAYMERENNWDFMFCYYTAPGQVAGWRIVAGLCCRPPCDAYLIIILSLSYIALPHFSFVSRERLVYPSYLDRF